MKIQCILLSPCLNYYRYNTLNIGSAAEGGREFNKNKETK